MKKNCSCFIVLVLMLLCIPAAYAWGECNHYYQKVGYEQVDDTHHYIIKKCYYCQDEKKELQEHSFSSYNASYEQVDNTNHKVTSKCTYCDRTVTRTEKHDLSYSSEYEKADDTYHYRTCRCNNCNAYVTEKEEHNLSSYSKSYESFDDFQHYGFFECRDCEASIKKLEKHDYWDSDYEPMDNDWHYKIKKCYHCGLKTKEKEKHTPDEYADYSYEKCDQINHYECYTCEDCDATVREKKKHTWSSYGDVVRKATPMKAGLLRKECEDCPATHDVTFPWKYHGEGSLSYDIVDFSPVYKDSTTMKVRLQRPLKGAVLKVVIGKKTYSTKLTNNSKKLTVKIKKSAYGTKMKLNLYYQGKCVGKDDSDQWDYVLYAKNIKKGMTKKQVKYLYNWGSPKSTGSASGGWSYWSYDDGSYIYFKKGKVKYWYNAAG